MKKVLHPEIETKLKELILMNELEPQNYDRGSDDPHSIEGIMKRQDTLMKELKELARANKTLLGRTVKFPMADSYALYVVTKVNKNTVQVTWVNYCDGWQDGRLGHQGNLDIHYVSRTTRGIDALEELMAFEQQKRTK